MANVVIDTNVLTSACIGSGASSKIVEFCLLKKITPVLSASLFLEYRDVLSRATIFRRARLDGPERDLLLRAFVSTCRWQDVYFNWRPNLVDEADNHVFELAVAANGATVITNNVRDFRSMHLKFPDILIETPQSVLQRMMP
ncbi:putative toxin-antitoxin system toxin component, PIN family [Rhizobium sp. 9140]|uniref:putative toxin-antitoxin system toxin component, PIN family n=1 Tax=Rhizobium sp. 9140 TaxID=1761900 RepID=UPI00079125DD|nr:putative toxin-antitoxin system toxin component, PIN family [Rhizobium sp. 9140]CZT35269.1 putative toxin-antitoxin system toxin component, PIN family [Rhizobium sp. 9140]